MDRANVAQLIKSTIYWYSLWAHRRTWEWKGFIEIPLTDIGDKASDALLDSLSAGGAI